MDEVPYFGQPGRGIWRDDDTFRLINAPPQLFSVFLIFRLNFIGPDPFPFKALPFQGSGSAV
jgi:hypothetical protein